jgi:hypothetical protein
MPGRYKQGQELKSDLANEAGAAAGKVAPAVGVVAASVGGWGVQEWMYAATFVYVLAQLGYLLWKWVREWRAGRKSA